MIITPAIPKDCLDLAELAQIAGEGIPGYFWADSQRPGQSLVETGAELLRAEDANFSYRNAHVARIDGEVAGMLLAYRLPAAHDNDENPADFPDFVRPLIELEQCVPESFYINMIAVYPRFRGRGVGGALMTQVDRLAREAGCTRASIEVFDSNERALRLYLKLGFRIADRRAMPPCDYVTADEVLLLTRPVARIIPLPEFLVRVKTRALPTPGQR